MVHAINLQKVIVCLFSFPFAPCPLFTPFLILTVCTSSEDTVHSRHSNMCTYILYQFTSHSLHCAHGCNVFCLLVLCCEVWGMLWCSEVLYHEVRFGVVPSGAVRFVVLWCCVVLRRGMVYACSSLPPLPNFTGFWPPLSCEEGAVPVWPGRPNFPQ